MKKILFFIVLSSFVPGIFGQPMSVDNLLIFTSFSPSKFDNYLSRNGFTQTGTTIQNDTIIKEYGTRRTFNFNNTDSTCRSITRADLPGKSFITYQTNSLTEFTGLKGQLRKAGFYCNQQEDSNSLQSLLYQNKDQTVRTLIKKEDSIASYSLCFHKKSFPKPRDIHYANDLLTFTSHEYLVYYFGEKNVKKDIYFFSQNEIANCSVLFLNTNRQVVFIWSDEENRCTISSLLFGGQQNLKSSLVSGKYVQENNWALRSGIRPGMSLQELRMRNGNDFSFYGGNSVNTGSVIPGHQGKLDLSTVEIILGCLNCSDDRFNTTKLMNADESIEEGRIIFVLSIVLRPI